jgi:hypothetical protein
LKSFWGKNSNAIRGESSVDLLVQKENNYLKRTKKGRKPFVAQVGGCGGRKKCGVCGEQKKKYNRKQ